MYGPVNLLGELQPKIIELLKTVASGQLIPTHNPWLSWITTFTPYIVAMILVVFLVVFLAKRQLSLVPKNRFVGFMEFFMHFTNNEIVAGVLGNESKPHVPFLATIFIFVLFSNVVGIIPGLRPATGTIGTTLVISLISFIYFIYWGVRKKGGWHYFKSIGPTGIKPVPLGAFIWFLELFSTVLRLLTLSVRLFANMFAGHLVLGLLAIMTSVFISPLLFHIQQAGLALIPDTLIGILWMALLTALYALEMFVACVQAFVFALLSSAYVFLATEAEH